MIGTKAIIKQNNGSSVSIKKHNIEPKSSHNSCRACRDKSAFSVVIKRKQQVSLIDD